VTKVIIPTLSSNNTLQLNCHIDIKHLLNIGFIRCNFIATQRKGSNTEISIIGQKIRGMGLGRGRKDNNDVANNKLSFYKHRNLTNLQKNTFNSRRISEF
jgi:hypothetical protein